MSTARTLRATAASPAPEVPEWPPQARLRSWQRAAMEAVRSHQGGSFLVSATPAAGKTTLGLGVAHRMLREGRIQRVVVLGPTNHICRQWAADAARLGIDLEPNRPNSEGQEPPDRHGLAITYQSIASAHRTHRVAAERRRTLLIADEPHHMGNRASWGQSARAAFEPAAFRLLLSGTPFRSDSDAIPWIAYGEEGLSESDFSYDYRQALIDRVCRPITFLPYDGEMEWISDGAVRTANFGEPLPPEESSRRLRTALDPGSAWMGEVLADAERRLAGVREAHPEAGGLVIASDQEHARAVAARLEGISGERPDVVISDEPEAGRRISSFAGSRRKWLVSVLMVSEGVDIPRLRVGVYATTARTDLFFRQVVGRFIRRTGSPERQMSYLLMPADARLKQLALEIEAERRHALSETGRTDEDEEPGGEWDEAPDEEPGEDPFAVLSAGSAEPGEAILGETTMQLFPTGDGAARAGAIEARPQRSQRSEPPTGEQSPRRPGEPAEHPSGEPGEPPSSDRPGQPAETPHEARERLRARRRALVADLARRTREPHRDINARINRATGVRSVGSATREQLERANSLLLRELR